jgi:hypothetical protein
MQCHFHLKKNHFDSRNRVPDVRTEWIKQRQALTLVSVWSSSTLGRWHPRSSVLLVLTRHSSPILNERWTRVINLSMFFLLCYDLTTILRSRARIGFVLRWFNTPHAHGSFFGDSIRLTLIECYQASIENLKLSGATYLLTHAGKFAKQTDLAFSYVDWIGEREVITDVLPQHGSCWFRWFGER